MSTTAADMVHCSPNSSRHPVPQLGIHAMSRVGLPVKVTMPNICSAVAVRCLNCPRCEVLHALRCSAYVAYPASFQVRFADPWQLG